MTMGCEIQDQNDTFQDEAREALSDLEAGEDRMLAEIEMLQRAILASQLAQEDLKRLIYLGTAPAPAVLALP